MSISLGSHKREGCKNSRLVQRNQKGYWDRPIGDIIGPREKRRYIFQLEKFDPLKGL